MDERLFIVKTLLREGRLEEALKEARSIRDPYWRSYALRWVAESYAHDPEKALKIAEGIEEHSIRDETLASLSYLFSKNGEFKRAIEAARLIKDQFIRKKAFRSVSNLLAIAVARGGSEIRLSDLKLDERDIEDLKPLPHGVVYKDGKLMPGSTLHRIKGEVQTGVVERFEKRPKWKPPEPEFEGKEQTNEYVLSYLDRLLDEGKLEEAEKLAKGLPEPLRSAYLERIGVKYLEEGNAERAEGMFSQLEVANLLGYALIHHYGYDAEKALRYVQKVFDPLPRMLIAYELAKKGGVENDTLIEVLSWRGTPSKIGRVLKFLAFEMLEEAKKLKDDELRKTSKELFELGRRVEAGEYPF
ncbi:hypothetical protein [Thermococcus stetteri]|uniref:hypothetical protein n=1 Tax=Thermococcus stetteri TaxID=49900 RepID=UPI001AE47071|nr:hypothetical protein [Thermococcus stetteri]MBP1911936.1 tetratricopeptide (TPR) repeat protein [Thermococcus stetteri]